MINPTTHEIIQGDPYIERYQHLQGKLLDRYGVRANSRFVDLGQSGGRVHVLEAGTGAPLVLLHGGAGIGAEHLPVVARLARQFRVILPDRPGHGMSDVFSYDDLDLKEVSIGFIDALLDELQIKRAALVGNSFGGLMAVNFALARPQRVTRLVVLSFFPGINRKLPLMMRLMVTPVVGSLMSLIIGRPSIRNTRMFFSKLIVAHIERMPDELIELETIHSQRHASGVASLFRAGISFAGFRHRYVVGDELSHLEVPTVFVWGGRDAFMSADEARAVASRIAGARFLLIPDAGHMPCTDQPEVTGECLERALTGHD